MKYKILFLCYVLISTFLFLYSFTQVDLNLTLSQVSIWQAIQKAFQDVGYFQRPLSTGLYLAILGLLFILYFFILRSIRKGILSRRQLWKIILAVTAILVFSYPAFSYDMFNYMFTAKTILVYHKNPYEVIPLQFAGVEPWLSFMRWTHLPSAYTPLWILLTLPPFFLGFGYFLLIMWNLKLLLAAFYLAAGWLIGRILDREDKKYASLGIAIFALNPLIIIESLVSAHNDILMMTLVLAAMYFRSFLLFSLSVAIKLVTIFLIPVFFFGWERKLGLVVMIIGLIFVVLQREVLPWYLVWVMPFVALLPRATDVLILSAGASLGLLLRYAPYLYLGNWDPPAPMLKWWLTVLPVAISIAAVFFRRYTK